ncbi:hypothetical protein PG999_005955 [Apiospora kogelbergensis]|uniref:Uncharacterized protein n=1 Tax=Apiospora kogelbergensis TaxID=1337665 RepID=A0AAW0QSS6_9PEZI
MENDPPLEGRHSRTNRLMGKFFGAERKAEKQRERQYKTEQSANDISAFLGGNGDRLAVTHPPPPPPVQGHREYDRQQPMLALDTSRATRYPQSTGLEADARSQQSLSYRARSHSPPRARKSKGLAVRFVDSYPEIIGEGGDECSTVVAEIGNRKRSKSAPVSSPIPPTKQGHEYARQVGAFQEVKPNPTPGDGFIPGPIRRTQTGFVSQSDLEQQQQDAQRAPEPPQPPQPRTVPVGEAVRTRFLDTSDRKDENRRSFLEIQQHEQRQAEGMAFAEALRSASTSANSHHEWEDEAPSSSPETTPQKPQRGDVPPVVVQDPTVPETPPPPYRAQSQRVGSMDPGGSERPPMRAQSTRTQLPPLIQQSPPQLPPPRNPARRSPLPPDAPQASASPVAASPARSHMTRNQLPVQQAPPDFMNQIARSLRPTSPDELRLNTSNESPASHYPPSASSTFDISQPTPITQNPAERLDRMLSNSTNSNRSPERAERTPAAADEAFGEFVARTKHLYELFRLHAEQLKPLGSCRPDDLTRAALWWFIKGRMGVEAAVRNRASEPDETKALMGRYQAYTDLTKAYWLTELALPEIAEGKFSPADGEFGEVRQAIKATSTKLAGSMKRNGLMPPDEPFMPQMMDKSIWVEYPVLSQDITALLNSNWGSLLNTNNQANRQIGALEALPLGDTPQMFNYGRVPVDVYLMEQGMESNQTHFSCMLSINRPVKDSQLVFTVASQNGAVTLRIQSDKNAGPSFENLRWRAEANSLELKMPRGFMVALQCSKQDFRMLWNIYDFGSKVQSYLYPRQDETVAFRTQLRGFHYFDADPNSRSFPKEAVGQCEVGLYEKLLKEGSPTGPRTFHRGYRLAVVTGPRIRTLSGVTHFYSPQMPIQFAYLRGEQREPLLQLAFKDGKDKCRMVLSFNDEGEREKLLTLLKGNYVHNDEEVVAEVALQGHSISQGLADVKGGFQALQRLPWQLARIINDKYAGDAPPTVLAEKLRLEVTSVDGQGAPVGTITDRLNMAPGEFKVRLGTKDFLTVHILRHPQADMTVSIIDRPGLTDAPREFTQVQDAVSRSQTVRTYRFNSFKDLHAFEAGVTGYTVLFDGAAASLNISRRRMVVPVYKKWESGTARIQVVQQEKTIQLLAFFEGWHHGQAMGFVLKGTDVYEVFGKGSKAGLKLVDAKFPLPKVPEEGRDKTDDMAFVSLDMPDYAGEHDDISIVFDDEGGKSGQIPYNPSTSLANETTERDRLCTVLPAPVKGSRLSRVGK